MVPFQVAPPWCGEVTSGRSGTNSSMTGARPFLPNGLACDHPLPKVLETKQHRQHSLQLPVKMDLVAAEPLQLVGVEGLAGSVCTP